MQTSSRWGDSRKRTRKRPIVGPRIKEGRSTKASDGAVHEGREGSIEREMEIAVRSKVCERQGENGRKGGRRGESPEDGPRPVSRGIVGGDTGG